MKQKALSPRREEVAPRENPFRAGRVDALRFVAGEVELEGVMAKLARHGQRGALVGSHGTGKSTLLRAVGDRLVGRGLSPMPLFMNSDERGTYPRRWRSAVRTAGHGDALLLDGYDLLPLWARARVLFDSRSASVVVVTAHQRCAFRTVARTTTSPALLRRLVTQLTDGPTADRMDCEALWARHGGNLRGALRELYDRAGAHDG